MRVAATLLLLVCLIVAIGCESMPLNQGDLDDQLASQADLQALSLTELDRGNEVTAVILSLLAAGTSVGTTIMLSQRRRNRAALKQLTGDAAAPSLAVPTPTV